jgi:phosphohistidine phosphatase
MAKAPTRELLVMRHAKSDRGVEVRRDFDRPLAKRGKKDSKRMGRWLKERKLRPDLVIASPAVRARDTADRVAGVLGLDGDAIRREPRLYDAPVERILRILGEVPDSAMRVLLVAHNPGLEDLVLHLGGDGVEIPGDGKVLPTGAVARFSMPADWGRLPPGAGVLKGIVRPKDLGEE